MVDILESLNKEQKEAVLKTDGAVLVLAGAGTGKTRVLTSKIAFLLQSGLCYPSEILAVTFTNKAADEIKGRITCANKDQMWIGTFHSICLKIIIEALLIVVPQKIIS